MKASLTLHSLPVAAGPLSAVRACEKALPMTRRQIGVVFSGLETARLATSEAKLRHWAIAKGIESEDVELAELSRRFDLAATNLGDQVTQRFVNSDDVMNELTQGFRSNNLVSPSGQRWNMELYRCHDFSPVALFRRAGSRVGVIVAKAGRTAVNRDNLKLIGVVDRKIPAIAILLTASGMRLLIADEGQDFSQMSLDGLKPRLVDLDDLGENDIYYQVVAGHTTRKKDVPSYLLQSAFGMIIPPTPIPT